MIQGFYTKGKETGSTRMYNADEYTAKAKVDEICDTPNMTIVKTAALKNGVTNIARSISNADLKKISTSFPTIKTQSASVNRSSRYGQYTVVQALGWLDLSSYPRDTPLWIKGTINITMHEIPIYGWDEIDWLTGRPKINPNKKMGRVFPDFDSYGPDTSIAVITGNQNYANYAFGFSTFMGYQSGSPTTHFTYYEGDYDDYYSIYEDIIGGACGESGIPMYGSQRVIQDSTLRNRGQAAFCVMADIGTHPVNIDIKFRKKDEHFLTILGHFHGWKYDTGQNRSTINAGNVSVKIDAGEPTRLHYIKPNGPECIYLK